MPHHDADPHLRLGLAVDNAKRPCGLVQSHFTLPFDPSLGGSGRPVNSLWIPAFAGIHNFRQPASRSAPYAVA